MEEYSVTGIKNLFLRQSYIDAWNDYQRVVKAKEGGWDFVILTASNEDQAKGYQLEIDSRKQAGRIPLILYFLTLKVSVWVQAVRLFMSFAIWQKKLVDRHRIV